MIENGMKDVEMKLTEQYENKLVVQKQALLEENSQLQIEIDAMQKEQ